MARIDVFMKLEGAKELKRALRKQEKLFFAEMAQALPEEGQTLMSSANAAAPTKSGALKASAQVSSVVQEKRGRVRVAAAYVDEKAAAVHEGIHWGAKVEGTKGFKWYERALNGFEAGFVERIAARLRRLVGGN